MYRYSFLKVNEIYLYAVGKTKRGLVDYLLDGVRKTKIYFLLDFSILVSHFVKKNCSVKYVRGFLTGSKKKSFRSLSPIFMQSNPILSSTTFY